MRHGPCLWIFPPSSLHFAIASLAFFQFQNVLSPLPAGTFVHTILSAQSAFLAGLARACTWGYICGGVQASADPNLISLWSDTFIGVQPPDQALAGHFVTRALCPGGSLSWAYLLLLCPKTSSLSDISSPTSSKTNPFGPYQCGPVVEC